MLIQNNTKIPIPLRQVRKTIGQILETLAIPKLDFDLTFVTDRSIQKLNHQFRQKNLPTDVLSFPLHNKRRARQGSCFLGDLVLSPSTIQRQAREYEVPFSEELAFMITHGILHLLGYDHERSRAQAHLMQNLEKKILKKLGFRGKRALT